MYCWTAHFYRPLVAWAEYPVATGDRTLFVGVPTDLRTSTRELASNEDLACILDGAEPRCITRIASERSDCPGGLAPAHPLAP